MYLLSVHGSSAGEQHESGLSTQKPLQDAFHGWNTIWQDATPELYLISEARRNAHPSTVRPDLDKAHVQMHEAPAARGIGGANPSPKPKENPYISSLFRCTARGGPGRRHR